MQAKLDAYLSSKKHVKDLHSRLQKARQQDQARAVIAMRQVLLADLTKLLKGFAEHLRSQVLRAIAGSHMELRKRLYEGRQTEGLRGAKITNNVFIPTFKFFGQALGLLVSQVEQQTSGGTSSSGGGGGGSSSSGVAEVVATAAVAVSSRSAVWMVQVVSARSWQHHRS